MCPQSLIQLAQNILFQAIYIDFCRLLITFANNLDPEQDRQNVDPDLDPNGLTP